MDVNEKTRQLAELEKQMDELKKPTPHIVAERFIQEQGDKKMYYDNREWHVYNGKSYTRVEDEVFILRTLKHFNQIKENEKKVTSRINKEIIEQVKSLSALPEGKHPPCFIEGDHREVIPLNNGLLDIKKLIVGKESPLLPHTSDYLCHNILGYDYDPGAKSTKWDVFLEKVLPNQDQRDLLQEWMGYNLISSTGFEAFMIFLGDGANGKSVVCQVLTQLLGIENISALGLEHLSPDKFMFGMVVGKMANICDDLNEVSKNNEGHLKNFVGGSIMTYNVKGKPPRMFKPTAKLTFATNQLPRVTDRSQGIWRRLQIIPFQVSIPIGERNLKLKTYAYWEPELAGIFNWSLTGLKRLMRSGQFTLCKSSEIEKQDYKESAQPELQFMEECAVFKDGEYCVQKEFHAAYKEWCFDHGFKPMNSKTLSKACIAHHPHIKLDFHGQDSLGKRVRSFQGLRLRHSYDA